MATDKDLYDRARGGDDDAAAQLLERHNTNLIRWLRKRGSNTPEDVAQEAWIAALTTAAAYSGGGAFEGWLRTIASRIRVKAAGELERPSSSPPTSPSRLVLRGELRQAIAGIDNAEQREAAWRCWVDGHSPQAIAAATPGLKVSTVHSRLRLARQRLEEVLRPGSTP